MNTPPTNVVPITKTIEIPEPGFPMLTRMISEPLFPSEKRSDQPHREPEPMTWIVGQSHPLVPDMRVMRMFVDRGGVEIYSVSSDGRSGTRNLIPMRNVRIIEEAMPLDVFIEELAAAENDEEEEEDEDEVELDQTGQQSADRQPDPGPAAATTNGQSAPS